MSGKGKVCNDRLDLGGGSSLLNFMNFASGNLKSALEKPANFKRNINHRRYLQKQLRKNEVKSPMRKSGVSHIARPKASSKAHEKRSLVKNIANTWRTEINPADQFIAGVQVEKAPALRERNFPLSFWQEPIVRSPPKECGNFYDSLQQFQTRNPEDHGLGYGTGCDSFLESWENCGGQELSPQPSNCESVPSTLSSDDSILEEFLTGEELTRSIDIKDLYVPELCFTDRSAEGSHEEELHIATPMSPSQYILSPSEQGFFNFQFEQEEQSQLPPISSLAFLNPCSLSAGQSCAD